MIFISSADLTRLIPLAKCSATCLAGRHSLKESGHNNRRMEELFSIDVHIVFKGTNYFRQV
jgi:hypothetical protein